MKRGGLEIPNVFLETLASPALACAVLQYLSKAELSCGQRPELWRRENGELSEKADMADSRRVRDPNPSRSLFTAKLKRRVADTKRHAQMHERSDFRTGVPRGHGAVGINSMPF